MRVYLDNCCYGRPYDDQTQLRISLETQAKLSIQHSIVEGKIELASSFFVVYENGKKKNPMVKDQITAFIKNNSKVYVDHTAIPVLKNIIMQIESTGIKALDASHIAAAIYSGCDCLITTDDRILRYETDKIKIIDPIQFIRMEEVKE